MMIPSAQCVKLVKHFEGFRLRAYLCPAGVWTIGWGTTGEVDGVYISRGMEITEEKAEECLNHDLMDAAASVNACVTVPLDQGKFDALISFVYNLGGGALRKSTLLRLVNRGLHDGVPAQFRRWTKAHVPGKGLIDLPGLVRRRNIEAILWETGKLTL